MNGRVIYLNAWLDCPDLILRRNYSMQEKITEAKIHFFYKLKEEGATEERAIFTYKVWIQKNRAKIKAVPNEISSDSSDDDISPTS